MGREDSNRLICVTDEKAFLSHLNLSLERMGIDYIDIYQLHGVNSKEIMEKVMGEDGAYFGLKEAVSSGKVRYFAFSSHSSHIAKKLMRIQCINYIIRNVGELQYACRKFIDPTLLIAE